MRIKSITLAGKADVFNMEVDDTHDFVIQGGVVAHKCPDETRYFCMSRPIKPRVKPAPDEFWKNPASMFLDIKKEDIIARPKRGRMEVLNSGE